MKFSAIILTPISKGAIIPPSNFEFPRVFSELEPISSHREVNINANRNKLQEIYRTMYFSDYHAVLLMDSDVVATNDQLLKLIENYKDGCTACLRTKPTETDHVIGACCLLNGSDYLKIDYLNDSNVCQCLKLPNPFYIDGEKATETRYDRTALYGKR